MYIDYKMPVCRVTKDGTTTIKVVIYKGDIATEEEKGVDGVMTLVTRYRRTAMVKTFSRTFDRALSRVKIIKALNLKLKEEAESRGFSVIVEQSDV